MMMSEEKNVKKCYLYVHVLEHVHEEICMYLFVPNWKKLSQQNKELLVTNITDSCNFTVTCTLFTKLSRT